MNFSRSITDWYQENSRQLPWRDTRDPYPIWLSEVILQQTRVVQGLPYFNRFYNRFPTVVDLANAPQEEVIKLWQGLGYYSRARNLHAAAQQIRDEGGKFPDTYKSLLHLRGVGEYTAAAIASFAYGERVAVVDGNVYRVLSRVYGISTPINSSPGVKEFKTIAARLIKEAVDPAMHNQAIMELGALQCTPRNPRCTSCPLQQDCVAFASDTADQLPVKIKKVQVKSVHYHYLVAQTPSGKTLLTQRPESGIWAGLYEFPNVESSGALMPFELVESIAFKNVFEGLRFRESVYNQEPIIHKLSHRKIHAYFWVISLQDELPGGVEIKEAYKKPMSKLMQNFMQEYWKLN
ncbi:MAG: A/G-specific adenine glycosylase [Nonlabens sp.]